MTRCDKECAVLFGTLFSHADTEIGKGVYIGKAQTIISELNTSLNQEKGGQIAVSLETLYLYINNQLSMANLKNSVSHLDDALRVMKELHEGWKAIIQKSRQEAIGPKAKAVRSGALPAP